MKESVREGQKERERERQTDRQTDSTNYVHCLCKGTNAKRIIGNKEYERCELFGVMRRNR